MSTFRDYLLHGWVLCEIPLGSKGPRNKGWNTRENGIRDPGRGPQLAGAGLCHAWSGTCAIDVDDYTTARTWLSERGVDLDALMLAPESVQISSGKPGRAKLLYVLPTPLASLKVAPYTRDEKDYFALELRCASKEGLSVQDCLPPTMHPETGRPYEWKFGDELAGDWRNLPPLPQSLETIWRQNLEPVVAAPAAPATPLGAEFAELQKLLLSKDPDGPYEDWLKVGAAIHHETQGSQDGYRLFDAWSARGKKYAGKWDTENKWRSFRTDAANPVTLGSLRREAVAAPTDFSVTPGGDAPDVSAGDGSGVGGNGASVSGGDVRVDAVMQRLVGEHVIYVANQDLYFDTRSRRMLLSDRALRNAFCPSIPMFEKTTKKGVEMYSVDPVKWLTSSKFRRERDVESVGMHPGAGNTFTERGKKFVNSFDIQGVPCAMNPNVEPLRPKGHEMEAFRFAWGRMTSPIFQRWLMKFYAHALQKPGVKIRSAPLLVSQTTGTGKSTLMHEIPKLLFGSIGLLTESQIRGQFNGELLNHWWITMEECYAGTTKGERRYMADKIKPWITNDDMSIRMMNTDAFSIVNRSQFTGCSNHLDALQLDDDEERRWGVCAVEERRWTEGERLGVFHDFLGTERAPGVLKYLFMNESLTGFNPSSAPPVTASKKLMVASSMGQWEAALVERMAAQEAPFDRDLFRLKEVTAQVTGLGAMTAHKLAQLLRAKPFNCTMLDVGHRTERLWAWRNIEAWKRQPEAVRIAHVETGARPDGEWFFGIPRDLAEMRAERDDPPAEDACDLL